MSPHLGGFKVIDRLRVGIVVAGILMLCAASAAAVERIYPAESWQRLESPEDLGWCRGKLQAARDYADTIQTAAVMIVVDGQVLDEWGETAKRYNIHSIRKSLLSALYGIHVHEKRINPGKSLKRLGIDDNEPSLTPQEKEATIVDLLKARSGVYHPALYESAATKALRPQRGSHPPGTFWYYNNWDFNVLGTIFERETKTNLFAEFKTRIAEPIGMQDFQLDHCSYLTGPDSVYPAYLFHMTARDMARFGLLFARQGEWEGRQIIPANWIAESTTPYSDTGEQGGYGYMWWIAVEGRQLPGVTLPDGSYVAHGANGHCILVMPNIDTVIVHRVNTYVGRRRVTDSELGKLVGLILAARMADAEKSRLK